MFSLFKPKNPLVNNFPSNYMDLHSHLLPGVDDGSKSFEESLDLLKKLEDYGIQKIVLTPHIMEGVWENSRTYLEQRFQELQAYLKKEKFNAITLYLAAEYMLDSNFSTLLKEQQLLTVKANYILVELSYMSAPVNLYELLFEIQLAGYKPILAHPERYAFFHQNFKEYHKLKEVGCLFQLNLLSLSNYYGIDVQAISKKLLKENLIDFTGIDVHHRKHLNYLEKINNPSIVKLIQPILENNARFAQEG
ncbi:CpsB/CapC family capsule biosynthesis tyrosine phosphatase [Lutibacter sp.]|uniref:tyrosine-protein phosphatase n=1 Tax=Lutibacter sp. TaxID=1925666 RepID=UPI001A34CF1C|nr:CpsB/CapC family capsule biosynthesis tyrosine phosphatase [Lutibacter sp.]MBI9041565.1 histidinol phosphatase [Lutibacter sp.]